MPRKEPQNIEAEINALGCAFLSKDALDKVCEELTSEMFYEKKNQNDSYSWLWTRENLGLVF